MIRNPRPHAALGAVLALLLLVMQVTGLHQHRHAEAANTGHDHGTQIHFEDAGIHADDPEHAQTGSAMQASHPHTDIEVKVLDSGLVKPVVDFSMVALLAWVIVLCLPSRAQQEPPRPLRTPEQRPPRYAVRPPSQAPPLTRAIAV